MGSLEDTKLVAKEIEAEYLAMLKRQREEEEADQPAALGRMSESIVSLLRTALITEPTKADIEQTHNLILLINNPIQVKLCELMLPTLHRYLEAKELPGFLRESKDD